MFLKDTAGSGKSVCNAGCAQTWPPLTLSSGDQVKPDGLPGTLSLITRNDGTKQVAYNGQPLYFYARDKAAGDTKSQAVAPESVGQKARITYDSALNVFTKCDLCSFRDAGPACIERCPVNAAIKQGTIKSNTMCLDLLKPENKANFTKMRDQQTPPAGGQ